MRKLLIWTQPAAQFFSVCIPASIRGAGGGVNKINKTALYHFVHMIILGKYAVITFHHLLSKLDESCSYSKAIQLQHSLIWLEQIWLQIRGTLFPLEIGCRLLLHGGIRRGGAARLAGRWKLCKVRIINWHLLPEGHYLLSIIHYQYIIGQEGSGKWKIWQWKDPFKLRVSAQTIW